MRVRYNKRSDGAQPPDDLSCVVEQSHVGIAGGEGAIWRRVVRVFLNCKEQLRHCFLEAQANEMRGAQQTEGHANAGTRTETKRGLHVLYCQIRLPGPEPESAADVPAAREAGVERQSTVDQRHHGTEILAEIAQRKGGIGDGAGIVTGYLQSPTGEIDALATVRRWIIAPGVQATPIVAERGPSESRPIMRISFDRFFEKLQCLWDLSRG